MMTGYKTKLKAIARDRRGEMFVDVLVKLIVMVVLVLGIIQFFSTFIKIQNVNHVAQRLTRAIEVSGTTQGIDATFIQLRDLTGLDGATYSINATYFDASGAIQLRDTFTVEVQYTYYLNFLTPDFAPPVQLPVSLSKKLSGMSEVYWKT